MEAADSWANEAIAAFGARKPLRSMTLSSDWTKVYEFLREHPDVRAGTEDDCLRFLEAVLWKAHTTSNWRSLPTYFGSWRNVYKRFAKWSDKGVWEALYIHLLNESDCNDFSIDKLMALVRTRKNRKLRRTIVRSFRSQGFQVRKGCIEPPTGLTKNQLRELHATAVACKIEQARERLQSKESKLLRRLASGENIAPEQIRPRLVEVLPGSEDEILFRYACLHWSIPVSSGYGKRLRFLVVDDHNGKLMGLIGLGGPRIRLRFP